MRSALLLLVAVGLLAAGCGGGGGGESTVAAPPLTKAQYQAKLQGLSNQVGARLRRSIGPSLQLKQSDVPKLQRELRSVAARVAALRPPPAVANLHVQLVAALRGLARDLPTLAVQLERTKDPSVAIAALFGADSVQALIRVQQAFKDKGYDISSLLDAGSGP